MKIREAVERVLTTKVETRNSPALLMWEVYRELGAVFQPTDFITTEALEKQRFLKHPPATILREARRWQRSNKGLHPTLEVVRKRRHYPIEKPWTFAENVDISVWDKLKNAS